MGATATGVPLATQPAKKYLTSVEIAERFEASPISVRKWITGGVRVTDPETAQWRRVRLKARKVGGCGRSPRRI